MTADRTAALGFAPHSGWAAVVAVSAEGNGLRVLVRDRIEMADPGEPEARQPYHAVEEASIAEGSRRLAAYAATAERMAYGGLREIVGRLAGQGRRVIGVGILDSAGRVGNSLADTLASHALIHTADGNHFRSALAAASQRCRLDVSRVRARDLESEASAALGREVPALQGILKALGRETGPPWGADQKAAALMAWLVLARASVRGRRRAGRWTTGR